MRRSRLPTPGLLLIAALVLVGVVRAAPAAAFQDASPAAGTPAVEPQPTEAVAQPAVTPAATPAAPAETDVVTLVLWYRNALDQDIIELFPLTTDAAFVASAAPGAQPVGTADFPVDGSPPTIALGETTFETYPRPDGVIERWTWLDDFEGARPGTLVMQVAATGGAYQDYFGTATFVSRDEGGAGGVLTIALRPPSLAEPAADEAAPAEAAPAEDAAADAAADPAAEAIAPDVTPDPGTVIIAAPDSEGEAPGGIEEEEPLEPAA